MKRSLLVTAVMAVSSACTFDGTGLSAPSQQPSYFGDESDSTAWVPTTGADTPGETDDVPSTGAPTTGPGWSTEEATEPFSSSSDEGTGSPPAVCGVDTPITSSRSAPRWIAGAIGGSYLALSPGTGFQILTVALFVVIIAFAMLGVLAGGMATWFRQGRWRNITVDIRPSHA